VQAPAPPQATDLNLAHLRAELARVEVLVRRAFQRWQLAGHDPARSFRGLHISEADAQSILARPFASSWGHNAVLSAADAEASARAEEDAIRQSAALLREAAQAGQTPRLPYLAGTFGLDRFDLDTLLICLAPALDLRYEWLYAYLQNDVTHRRPTANLVLDLLCQDDGTERLAALDRFTDAAPLFASRLLARSVEPGGPQGPALGQFLRVDDTVISWLLGSYLPNPGLASCSALSWPEEEPADALTAGRAWPELERLAGLARPLVVFSGPDESRQEASARLLAARTGWPLLTVDLARTGPELTPVQTLGLALRDAQLMSAWVVLQHWDACLSGAGAAAPNLEAQVLAFPEILILTTRGRWQPAAARGDRSVFQIDFPLPDHAQRTALWAYFMDGHEPGDAPAAAAERQALALSLSGQFRLTCGQIRDAAAAARDGAAQRGDVIRPRDLLAAAGSYSSPALSSLARKITPRYTWEDIILPADQSTLLREIVATVRSRPQVLEEWGVGRKLVPSNGITMLFAGPPGTGKTMAADAIAGDLGLDLFKIDLSCIVSKYIGETEKNLERIFSEAQSSNAILFFDEADAIFGKRSEVKDAHDRYANIEISYLLQRMESYDGVTILATNLRANLDEAFTRRLQFAVDFPFPEEEYRLRIWQTLFPPDVPRAPGLDFDRLARRFKLAGGNIRNIIVNACFLAAADDESVSMAHLSHAVRRELQKMGRLVGEGDLAA
jgi:hypothetical protein